MLLSSGINDTSSSASAADAIESLLMLGQKPVNHQNSNQVSYCICDAFMSSIHFSLQVCDDVVWKSNGIEDSSINGSLKGESEYLPSYSNPFL